MVCELHLKGINHWILGWSNRYQVAYFLLRWMITCSLDPNEEIKFLEINAQLWSSLTKLIVVHRYD